MAPDGPRRGGAPYNGRQPRSTATRGRGGIQKSSSVRPPRVDKDGDLDMSTSLGRRTGPGGSNTHTHTAQRGAGRGSGRGGSRFGDQVRRHIEADLGNLPAGRRSTRTPFNSVCLKINGVRESRASSNKDGGASKLLSFLDEKTFKWSKPRHIKIRKSQAKGDLFYVWLSKEDAEEVKKLNNFTFVGSPLTITEEEGAWANEDTKGKAPVVAEVSEDEAALLRKILEERYSLESKVLDLSELGFRGTDKEAKYFQETTRTEAYFNALMTCIEKIFPDAAVRKTQIEGVRLAGNKLHNLSLVHQVAKTLPDLKHLDLSDNLFDSTKALLQWRNSFKELETLVLLNNPIIQRDRHYSKDITRWFPMLIKLNDEVVQEPERVRLAKSLYIPQGKTDFTDSGGIAEQFLRAFFATYDTSKIEVLKLFYDERSCFSLSVATHLPKDNDLAVPQWSAYLKHSRNQTKITSDGTRKERFKIGRAIQDLWTSLPPTRHPSIEKEPAKYIVDCHPIQGLSSPTGDNAAGVNGLHITVHGEYEEINANNKIDKRSFTRSFLLGPDGQPDRGPVRVISDMLVLRAWSALPVTIEASATSAVLLPVPAAATAAAAAPTLDPAAVEVERKRVLVTQLAERSKLTLAAAQMCLEAPGVDWNFDMALVKFEELKSTLAPSFFQTQ